MAGVRGFNLRDLTQHGKPETGRITVNVKALPASAGIQSLFTVTGEIEVLGLVAVETVILSGANSLTIGFTPTGGSSAPAAIAAAPASPTVGAVGDVFIMPPTLGGALPAPVSATAVSAAAAGHFTCKDGIITVTTNATLTTGTLAWVLAWSPLNPKTNYSAGTGGPTVVND
jgi:hypothetical protein